MRGLVACEFSGIVRDAFRARGHDFTSIDLIPSVPYSTIGGLDTSIAEAPRRLLGQRLTFKATLEPLLAITIAKRVVDCRLTPR